MSFFYKNTYSNLLQQKFLLKPAHFKSKISLEIKYESIENLNDESILKSFYFFFLMFNSLPSFKNFNSRYHLGKTFYTFQIFKNFEVSLIDMFLFYSFFNNMAEPNKISLISKINHNNLYLNLSDLKSFFFVESNPHFFK